MSTSKKIDINRFLSWHEAQAYHEKWNELILSSLTGAHSVPSIFQTYEWNHSWWQAFGAEYELLLLAAFEDAQLIGIAPLMISHKKLPLPIKTLHFIGSTNHASDYSAFIHAPGREDTVEAFGEWLTSQPNIWDQLDLKNILSDSTDDVILDKKIKKNIAHSSKEYICDAPTRLLGSPEEDKELVNRKSLKRHFNWFKNQGTLTYGHLDKIEDIRGRLDHFFEQHIARRSVTENASQFIDERQREFYRILVENLFPKGWLRFFTVDLDGATIAYHFGFEFGNKFYWYKPTFDIEYIKKSPGEVLLKTLFEYAIARKLKEFDFTVGNESFKYRFSNHIRKLYRMKAFRSWPYYLIHEVKVRPKQWAKQWLRPAAHSLIHPEPTVELSTQKAPS